MDIQEIKQDWITQKAETRNDNLGGKGLFANARIEKGEEVLVWGGEYTDSTGSTKAKRLGKLVMQWDDDLFSIEDRGDETGYFVNHSCDPNLWMKDAYTLSAKRDINTGEQLTADYAMWEADKEYISKWSCQCEASTCRKRITGKDWKLEALQERYHDHFSPLINKRIKKLQKSERSD